MGVLALSAAAWVRTPSVLRGMLASVGIVVGALPSLTLPLIAAMVLDQLGAVPGVLGYAAAAVPTAIGIGCAIIMWRGSARPWDRPPRSISWSRTRGG